MTQISVGQHGLPVGVESFGFFDRRSGPLRLPLSDYVAIPKLLLIFIVLCLSYLTKSVPFRASSRTGHCGVTGGVALPGQGQKQESNSELLNIREAANFLHVSEVSLRRWTNDGKLPCLRVGGRKERRFRRDDLVAFLDSTSKRSSGPPASDEPLPGPVMIEDFAIERGAHLCSFYRSDLGRLKISVSFLAAGLKDGEFCMLIASPDAAKHILENLLAVYPELDVARSNGQLFVSGGAQSGDQMYRELESNFVRALTRGYSAMRLVGDMAWAIDRGVDFNDLMEFEKRYNHDLAQRYPVVSVCQYDSRLFPGEVIHEALVCHEDTFNYPLSRFL
jgi:excisionase family DNA binding protein